MRNLWKTLKTSLFKRKPSPGDVVETPEQVEAPENLLALTYKPNHPVAFLVLHYHPVGMMPDGDELDPELFTTYLERMVAVKEIVAYRKHYSDEELTIKHFVNKAISLENWPLRLSMFVFNYQPDFEFRNLTLLVDPEGVTEFHAFMATNAKITYANRGYGTLEESMGGAANWLLTELDVGSHRISSTHPLFPKGVTGWVIYDSRGKGTVNRYIHDFFKPDLKVVK